MHNTVVSKIRVYNPNKKGTPAANYEYCKYIATRPGVVTEGLHDNLDMSDNDTYVKYIAYRPRSHGLFGNIDTSDWSKAANVIKKNSEKGNIIYRGIISLAEEDAMELGYDKADKWNTLLHSTMADVAEQFNIPVTRLQWVGAFHLEKGHPHVHYMFWDKEKVPKNSYIHVAKQQRCREIFSTEIFQEERQAKVIDKTASRDLLIEYGKDIMSSAETLIKNPNLFIIQATKIPDKIYPKEIEALSKQLTALSEALPSKGRIAYAFMPPDIKDMVDNITESLLMRKDMQAEVLKFLDLSLETAKAYSPSKLKEKISQENAYRDIKKRLGNLILKTAKGIRETDASLRPDNPKSFSAIADKLSSIDNGYFDASEKKYSFTAAENYISTHLDYDVETGNSILASPTYKKAVQSLKQFSETRHNRFLAKALDLLKQEAVNTNPLAFKKLGQIYKNNKVLSDMYNKKCVEALETILHMEPDNAEARHELGKLYAYGIGTEQNSKKAFSLFKSAVLQKNTDANLNYTLGCMYHYGKGIEPDDNQAVYYLEKAKLSNHAYANDLLGKIYASQSSPAYHPQLAEKILKPSADKGDSFSQYTLANLYLDKAGPMFSLDKALNLLECSANQGYVLAQYSLGRLYLDSKTPIYNLQKGIFYLTSAAKQNHLYACLSLGDFFSAANGPLHNIESAENYYLQAINLSKKVLKNDENPSLNYSIGQIYLNKEFSLYNPSLAVNHLEKAAVQGEAYAQNSLIHIYLDKKSAYYDLKAANAYLKILESRAISGDKLSQYLLGKLHIYKILLSSSKKLGLNYLQKSARQDYEPANKLLQQEQRFKEQLITRQSFKLILDVFNCLTTENINYENSLNMKAHSKQVRREELRKNGIELNNK